jgi:hypothetical protein
MVALAMATGGCMRSGGAGELRRSPSGEPRAIDVRLEGNALVRLSVEAGELRASDEELVRWVLRSARAIEGYFGRFPLPRAEVIVLPVHGDGVRNATTTPEGGGTITIEVGERTVRRALDGDWVLVHEMVHLAQPHLEGHPWFGEGQAVYVELLARAAAGFVPAEQVWSELMEGVPEALPALERTGLDEDPGWAATYWGGALFFLLADVEIRERTRGERSLRDALRAILEAGGDLRSAWSLEHALGVADQATGTAVFSELHGRLGRRGERVDIERLWRRLGITRTGRRIRFDDTAPLAWVRRAIAGA